MRTNFKIKTENGKPMIFEYTPNVLESSEYTFKTNLIQASLGIVVYLEIDNLKCSGEQVSKLQPNIFFFVTDDPKLIYSVSPCLA